MLLTMFPPISLQPYGMNRALKNISSKEHIRFVSSTFHQKIQDAIPVLRIARP
ncbi:hypothetical protein YC2023_052117 [Brassica napus]